MGPLPTLFCEHVHTPAGALTCLSRKKWPSSARKRNRLGPRLLTVAACGVCFLLSVGTLLIYIFGVFVRPLAGEFHWTRTQVATALITGQFMVAVTSPLWGWLIDRFGPRRVILPSIVGMSLAFASLSTLTPHRWCLYLLYALFTAAGRRRFSHRLLRCTGAQLQSSPRPGARSLPDGHRTGSHAAPIARAVFRRPLRLAHRLRGPRDYHIGRDRTCRTGSHPQRPAAASGSHSRTRRRDAAHRYRAFLTMSTVLTLISIAAGGAFATLVPMLSIAEQPRPKPPALRTGRNGGHRGAWRRRLAARSLQRARCSPWSRSPWLPHCCCSSTPTGGFLTRSPPCSWARSWRGGRLHGILVRRYFGNAAFSRLTGLPLVSSHSAPAWAFAAWHEFRSHGRLHPGLLLFIAFSLVAALGTFAMPAYNMPAHLETTLRRSFLRGHGRSCADSMCFRTFCFSPSVRLSSSSCPLGRPHRSYGDFCTLSNGFASSTTRFASLPSSTLPA